ncbi:hypothetical protein ABIB66_006022 [Bradyrhizobium sp. F1.13.3]
MSCLAGLAPNQANQMSGRSARGQRLLREHSLRLRRCRGGLFGRLGRSSRCDCSDHTDQSVRGNQDSVGPWRREARRCGTLSGASVVPAADAVPEVLVAPQLPLPFEPPRADGKESVTIGALKKSGSLLDSHEPAAWSDCFQGTLRARKVSCAFVGRLPVLAIRSPTYRLASAPLPNVQSQPAC